jgi:hypothetical protein
MNILITTAKTEQSEHCLPGIINVANRQTDRQSVACGSDRVAVT